MIVGESSPIFLTAWTMHNIEFDRRIPSNLGGLILCKCQYCHFVHQSEVWSVHGRVHFGECMRQPLGKIYVAWWFMILKLTSYITLDPTFSTVNSSLVSVNVGPIFHGSFTWYITTSINSFWHITQVWWS